MNKTGKTVLSVAIDIVYQKAIPPPINHKMYVAKFSTSALS